jgi:hypothetical protein
MLDFLKKKKTHTKNIVNQNKTTQLISKDEYTFKGELNDNLLRKDCFKIKMEINEINYKHNIITELITIDEKSNQDQFIDNFSRKDCFEIKIRKNELGFSKVDEITDGNETSKHELDFSTVDALTDGDESFENDNPGEGIIERVSLETGITPQRSNRQFTLYQTFDSKEKALKRFDESIDWQLYKFR